MTTPRDIQDMFHATAYDSNGEKLGSLKEIFIDDTTGQPTFIEVGHGLFGMKSSLVPLRGHVLSGEELRLAFSKDQIEDAPQFDAGIALTPADQNALYQHFDLMDTEDTEIYSDSRELLSAPDAEPEEESTEKPASE